MLLPFATAYGTILAIAYYGAAGLLLPVSIIAIACWFNRARRARQNTGRPEIDDRGWR